MVADDELMNEQMPEERQEGKRRPALILIVLIILGLLGYRAYTQLSGPEVDEARRASSTADETTRYDRESQARRSAEDEEATAGVRDAFTVDDPPADSSVVAVEKRLNATDEKVDRLGQAVEQSSSKVDRQLQQIQNRIDEQISEVVELIEQQSIEELGRGRRSTTGDRNNDLPTDGLPPLPGDDEDEDPTAEESDEEDDFPYQRIGSRRQSNQSDGSGNGLQLPGSSGNSGGNNNAPSSGQAPPPPPGDRPPSLSADEGVRRTKELGNSIETAAGREKVFNNEKIPGLSFVHVTNLHGVACPVATSGGGGDPLFESVPIVLPVVGEFRAPNGKTYDLGSPHLYGTCFGSETSRPAITVKIERLSYVGPDGEEQYIPVNGYLVDRRDNEIGIAGYVDKAGGRELAAAAAAAGLAAAGDVFAQSQGTTTQVTGTGGSGIVQSLPGDAAARAALGRSFGAVANEIAEMYRDAAERLVPVVRVESGLPITFVNTQPIEYLARSGSEVANVE